MIFAAENACMHAMHVFDVWSKLNFSISSFFPLFFQFFFISNFFRKFPRILENCHLSYVFASSDVSIRA